MDLGIGGLQGIDFMLAPSLNVLYISFDLIYKAWLSLACRTNIFETRKEVDGFERALIILVRRSSLSM